MTFEVGLGVTGIPLAFTTGSWYVAFIVPERETVTGTAAIGVAFGIAEGEVIRNFCSTVLPKLYAVVMPPPKSVARPNSETMATIGVTLILNVVEKRVCL